MKILAIETSCDETAVSILECEGDERSARFTILGNALLSQIDLHQQYGGVFPALAKREHAKNLVPLLEAALEEAELLREDAQAMPQDVHDRIAKLLEREPGLSELFFEFIREAETPGIDAIAVTAGPGLEPALWVGVNFASALALAWGKPLIPANHMEGHVLSALAESKDERLLIEDVSLPLLALLISGGHTELVLMKSWLEYELIGQTRDDAVGEAFDKAARMLGLPYPGGPEISKLADIARRDSSPNPFSLPRPMLKDPHCDFSFSGLKTSVLYLLKGMQEVSEVEKQQIAREFEDAVGEVLWAKTARALEETGAKVLVLGGGVSNNKHIRKLFAEKITDEYPNVSLHLPTASLTTDNAVMIGLAGFYRFLRGERALPGELRANGNLSLV
ncbi:MAG: tRNA (adenosine(37)-N6)-threonylcarbamoyltransferase complex transferase subunit TsaD [bacterium]